MISLLKKISVAKNVSAASISPDGKLVAVSLSDAQVQLLDSSSGKKIASITHERLKNPVIAVVFVSNSLVAFVATKAKDYFRFAYDIKKKKFVLTSTGDNTPPFIPSLCAYKNTLHLVTSRVSSYDIKDESSLVRPLQNLPAKTKYIQIAPCSKGSQFVVSNYEEGKVCLVSEKTFKTQQSFAVSWKSTTDIAATESGTYVAAVGDTGSLVVWNIKTESSMPELVVKKATQVVFHPEGDRLFIGTKASGVIEYDCEKGEIVSEYSFKDEVVELSIDEKGKVLMIGGKKSLEMVSIT